MRLLQEQRSGPDVSNCHREEEEDKLIGAMLKKIGRRKGDGDGVRGSRARLFGAE